MRCLLITTGVWLLAATPGRPEEFRSPHGDYSFTLPDGWDVIPDKELADMAGEVNEKLGGIVPPVVAGYRQTVGPGLAERAAVLVMELPGPQPGELVEEYERRLNKNFAVIVRRQAEAVRDVIGDFRCSEPFFHLDKPLFDLGWVLDTPGGRLAGKTYGHIGKDKVVLLTCVTAADRYRERRSTFDGMSDSFRFESGHTATAGFLPRDVTGVWVRLRREPILLPVLVGLLSGVACVVGLGFYGWRQHAKARRLRQST